MKKVMEKVIFMVVGSLLTIIGCHFGTVNNNSTNAQINGNLSQPNGEFDLISCRALTITDANGNGRILLGSLGDIASIVLTDEDKKSRIGLTVSDQDANIFIFDEKARIIKEMVPNPNKISRGDRLVKMLDELAIRSYISRESMFRLLADTDPYRKMIKSEREKRKPDEFAIIQMQDDIIKALYEQFKLDRSTILQMRRGIITAVSKKDKLDKSSIIQMQDDIIEALNEQFKLDGSTIIQMQKDIKKLLEKKPKLDKSTIPQLQKDIIEALQKGLKKAEPVE